MWVGSRSAVMAQTLGLAAVDEELSAGHEARIVRGKESDRLGDFIRVADPADWDLGRHIVEQPMLLGGVRTGQPDKAWGLHRAWTDDVDPDAALLEVERPPPRQIAHRGLGGPVDAKAAVPVTQQWTPSGLPKRHRAAAAEPSAL
jgi:hypothetical protein